MDVLHLLVKLERRHECLTFISVAFRRLREFRATDWAVVVPALVQFVFANRDKGFGGFDRERGSLHIADGKTWDQHLTIQTVRDAVAESIPVASLPFDKACLMLYFVAFLCPQATKTLQLVQRLRVLWEVEDEQEGEQDEEREPEVKEHLVRTLAGTTYLLNVLDKYENVLETIRSDRPSHATLLTEKDIYNKPDTRVDNSAYFAFHLTSPYYSIANLLVTDPPPYFYFTRRDAEQFSCIAPELRRSVALLDAEVRLRAVRHVAAATTVQLFNLVAMARAPRDVLLSDGALVRRLTATKWVGPGSHFGLAQFEAVSRFIERCRIRQPELLTLAGCAVWEEKQLLSEIGVTRLVDHIHVVTKDWCGSGMLFGFLMSCAPVQLRMTRTWKRSWTSWRIARSCFPTTVTR